MTTTTTTTTSKPCLACVVFLEEDEKPRDTVMLHLVMMMRWDENSPAVLCPEHASLQKEFTRDMETLLDRFHVAASTVASRNPGAREHFEAETARARAQAAAEGLE